MMMTNTVVSVWLYKRSYQYLLAVATALYHLRYSGRTFLCKVTVLNIHRIGAATAIVDLTAIIRVQSYFVCNCVAVIGYVRYRWNS